MVLHPVHLEHANLLERPPRNALGKLPVERLHDGFAAQLGYAGVEPLVLQHLGRAHHRHARVVARLHRRHQRELLAGRKEVIEYLGLFLGVVAVGSAGCAQDGVEKLAVAENSADAAREGDQLGVGALAEEVLDAGADGLGGGQKEDIVPVGGAGDVVVEVVDDEAVAVGGQGDVELREEGDQRGGCGGVGAEGEQDVALGVDEVEEGLGRQVGTETLGVDGQEEDVVVGSLAEVKEVQGVTLWCFVGDLEFSFWEGIAWLAQLFQLIC